MPTLGSQLQKLQFENYCTGTMFEQKHYENHLFLHTLSHVMHAG